MSNEIRQDGYVNLMNKWGTSQDASEGYRFQRELVTPDMELTTLYTDNGLFTKIIDGHREVRLPVPGRSAVGGTRRHRHEVVTALRRLHHRHAD